MTDERTRSDLAAMMALPIPSTRAVVPPADAQAPGQSALAAPTQPWSPTLVTSLSLGILLFTSLALLLSTLLMWRNRASGMQILRVFGVLSIVGASTFLVVAAYDKDQLTPIVGLFAAIAGYLLGRESSGDAASPSPVPGAPAPQGVTAPRANAQPIPAPVPARR